mmetsp:Transcript_144141/g.401603  ORF Transcript_144141/g.401603 Transcript_144141/m.401603 type:complete len:362 (+) Transcript_144141:2-1087(+)
MKAVVIGSDVSEYVMRHASLLHFTPKEEDLGGRNAECAQMDRPGCCQGEVSAELDPHTLMVLDCTPQFNILLQRRMLGRPFLNYVAPDDREPLREAVEATFRGQPQSITVHFSAAVWKPSKRCRHRSQPTQRRVAIKLRLCSSGGASVGSICLDVLPLATATTAEPLCPQPCGEAGDACFRCTDSDPGVQEHCVLQMAGTGPEGQCARSEAYAQEGLQSLPLTGSVGFLGELAAANRHVDEAVVERHAEGEHGHAVLLEPPPFKSPRLEAVMLHLVDLSRHFCALTFKESMHVLLVAMRRISEKEAWYAKRWGRPCLSWRCHLCLALNDEEDDVCEVCKLGEPADAETEAGEDDMAKSASG